MQAFINIQLQQKPIVDFNAGNAMWQKQMKADQVLYELDNFSDELSLNYGLELAKSADKLTIVVDATVSQEIGKTVSFFNQLLKLRSKTSCVLIGEHALLTKLLKKIGQQGFYPFQDSKQAETWLMMYNK